MKTDRRRFLKTAGLTVGAASFMRDLSLDEYPFRKLLTGLNQTGFSGYCLAEIPESSDPLRVLKYFRSLWLAYQNLL